MKFLLDTSVVIDFLRSKDKEQSLLYLLSEEDLSVSIVTHTELYAGKSVWESKRGRQELDKILSGVKMLSLTQAVSVEAGKIYAYNHTSDLIDAIIAATAIVYKCKLVTLNRKHFEKIPDLSLFND
jgi:predicted nucleic acid-binding protein